MTIQQEQKSRAIIIGSIISIVASVLAMCPLFFDLTFGIVSQGQQLGLHIMNIAMFRFILLLLIAILSVIFLIRKKSSIILSMGLILSEVVFIGLPYFVYANTGAQSLGGLFGSILMLIALIGSIAIGTSSFRK